ncbi:MAG: hypothetical protein HC933_15270 [Pleurocapsa sp. SU_196_0]|nr:hypothetical protein [Pleurocapsa sp. SU_196_0]
MRKKIASSQLNIAALRDPAGINVEFAGTLDANRAERWLEWRTAFATAGGNRPREPATHARLRFFITVAVNPFKHCPRFVQDDFDW